MAAALRVGFAGTPPFAATALTAILGAGFRVATVLTRPDRPQGRGLKLTPSAVKSLALERGLALMQPATLNDQAARAELAAAPIDVLVVAAYGLILPQPVLAAPRHGCINIHASLLPRWRGAAPIQRALLEGDRQTGVSIMQMDAGLDTGALISVRAVSIGPRDSAATLTATLRCGRRAIVDTLIRSSARRPPRLSRTGRRRELCRKISRDDAASIGSLCARHRSPGEGAQPVPALLRPVREADQDLVVKPQRAIRSPAPSSVGPAQPGDSLRRRGARGARTAACWRQTPNAPISGPATDRQEPGGYDIPQLKIMQTRARRSRQPRQPSDRPLNHYRPLPSNETENPHPQTRVEGDDVRHWFKTTC